MPTMKHRMYEHTTSITLYLTYAALMMGLLLCSLLSPLRTVTVDGHQLALYGVAIAFDTPPVGWNAEVSHPSESDREGSSSSSSGEGVRIIQAAFVSSTSSLRQQKVSALAATLEDGASSPIDVKETSASSTQAASSMAPSVIASLSTSSQGGSSSGPAAADNATHWVYLYTIPSTDVARCMTAYLVFAALCLLFSLLLTLTLVVLLLPTSVKVHLRVAMRVFVIAGPLSAILCFVMAAVLGLQGKLVRHVADGYYMNTAEHATESRLRSGFSTTVAAAGISLVVVLLSPLTWKE